MSEHDFTPVGLLSGEEQFTDNGKPVGFSVRDYWSFQFSNLWDTQEIIAEFLVAKALGLAVPDNKNGWALWDITYRGNRIEVKETGYFYSWQKDGKTSDARSFGITKAYSEYKDNNSTFERQNDIYVFCLNTGRTMEESNPLDLVHWEFYVVPTSTINELCGDNKSLSLSRLRKIAGKEHGLSYAEIRVAVDAIIDEMTNNQ